MTGTWRKNSRCRACGHREHGEYSSFDTTCPGCGASARWAWQIWTYVIERPVYRLFRRTTWEERPSDDPFAPDHADLKGQYIP